MGAPGKRYQLDSDVRLGGFQRQELEFLRDGIGRRSQRLRLGFELGLQFRQLPLKGRDVFLRLTHILRFLDRSAGSPNRRRRFAEIRCAERFPSKECSDDGGADRERSLKLAATRLRLLSCHGLFCTTNTILEGGNLGRVFLAEAIALPITLLATGLLEAHAKVTLRLTRPGQFLGAWTAEQVEFLGAV